MYGYIVDVSYPVCGFPYRPRRKQNQKGGKNQRSKHYKVVNMGQCFSTSDFDLYKKTIILMT